MGCFVPGWKIARVLLLRPEEETAESLQFHQDISSLTFTVPRLLHYALISLEARQ